MIKVCSLEFLNKDSFDVDIMSADGRVLFSAGSDITPELLLRLYFKDIYVEESIYATQKSADSTKLSSKVQEKATAGATLKSREDSVGESMTSADGVNLKSSGKDGGSTSEAYTSGVDLKTSRSVEDSDSELVDLTPIARDNEDVGEESYSGGGSRAGLGSRGGPSGQVATSNIIGPKTPSESESVEASESKTKDESPTGAGTDAVSDASGVTASEEKSSSRSSSPVGDKKSGSGASHKSSEAHSSAVPAEPVIEKDPNPPLEFDEEQAQRVSTLSVRLAAVLSLDSRQQDEVKQAAYYHNVGRSLLRFLDLQEADFKKRQAVAGYNHILNTLKLNPKIAEAAMFYNKKYQSSELNLKTGRQSDFPYSHIVAITNYYDDLTNQGLSENATLMKMLQLGGNKFNVFILHKFINMVRK